MCMGLVLHGKLEFLHWVKHIRMQEEINWLVVGDFNLLRNPSNRNRPGGNLQDLFLFKEAISAQGWVELPLHGRNILGLANKIHQSWRDWTVFSHQILGQ